MTSPFDRLMAGIAEPAFDGVFGRAFLFTPMRKPPQGRATPDAERTPLEIVGILDWEAPQGHGADAGMSEISAVSEQPVISVDRKYFPDDQPQPRRGDRFTDLTSNRVFEIVQPRPDDISRIEFDLVALGRPQL